MDVPICGTPGSSVSRKSFCTGTRDPYDKPTGVSDASLCNRASCIFSSAVASGCSGVVVAVEPVCEPPVLATDVTGEVFMEKRVQIVSISFIESNRFVSTGSGLVSS